jgi:hypothetical protein
MTEEPKQHVKHRRVGQYSLSQLFTVHGFDEAFCVICFRSAGAIGFERPLRLRWWFIAYLCFERILPGL